MPAASVVSHALRTASVFLEESRYHAGAGNCSQSLKDLARGSRALGEGRAMQRAASLKRDDDLDEEQVRAMHDLARQCIRR